jgi:hypothetical protein
MSNQEIPELNKYRELDAGGQLRINLFLISIVRENYRFNIHMLNDAESFNAVKLQTIKFEHEAGAIYVVFETITGDTMELPIDFLSRIEVAGQKEV